MKSDLMSMYIDDELNMEQKIELLETVGADRHYRNELIELLAQEKRLRSKMVDSVPPLILRESPSNRHPFFRTLAWFSSGLATALAAAIVWILLSPPAPPLQERSRLPHRFVVYRPDASRAELTGSFTRWEKIPMVRKGEYWETTIDLLPGEHRFSYIFDGNRRTADPTVSVREKDDFGGENSILEL